MLWKKNGWLLVLICCVLFVAPVCQADEGFIAQTAATQQVLDKESKQLIAMSNKLEQTRLSDSTLVDLQATIEALLTEALTIQDEALKKANQLNTLITALGPAPKENEPAEDAATAAKREQLNDQLAIYNGQAKQASAIISQAHTLINTITQHRLQNKAKNLLQRSSPLYHSLVWQDGIANSDDAVRQTWQNIHGMFNESIEVLKSSSVAWLTGLSFIVIALFSLLISWLTTRHFGQRHIIAAPTIFRKVMTLAAETFAKGLFPLAGAILFFYIAKQLLVINILQFHMFTHTLLAVFSIWIAWILIQGILAPNLPAWRLIGLQDASARLLSKQLFIFTILVTLNWYVHVAADKLPTAFLNPCEFILRIAVCISGLLLLRKHYWHITGAEAFTEDAPGTTKSAHFIFINFLRIAAIAIFISNPIFMLFGYIQLANAFFINFIQTALIIAVLLSLHILFYETLSNYMGVGKETIVDKTLNLGASSRRILHYWLIVCIDLIFFIVGTAGILLTWGLDKNDLWRFVNVLFTGFAIGSYHFALGSLLLAFIAFIVLFIITRIVQRFMNRRVFPYTNMDIGIRHALHQGIGYVGIIIALIVALGILGINLTSLALIAGALSVGIGFGLQNIVSNFISGIIVLVERPIKIGDRILVGTDEGKVKRISVRATEVEASDGSTILIPHSMLIAGTVRNRTFRKVMSKVEINLGVAYGTDPRQIEQLLLQIAQNHPDILRDPKPQVYFYNFGPSSLDLKLQASIQDIDKRSKVESELRFAIEEAFKQHQIDRPFSLHSVKMVGESE
jgi:small-conductance mechanosensitive channel